MSNAKAVPLKKHNFGDDTKVGYLLLAPWLFGFIFMYVIPAAMSIYYSFTDYNLLSTPNWVGLKNYQTIFQDDGFLHAFWYTALFALVSLLIINVLAFAVAYVLTKGIKGSNIFRTVFFMPNLIGGIVLGYIWLMIFDGILSNFDTAVVLETKYGFWGLIILMCWQQIGYMMIIYIAGLQAIPEDMLEAAKIDGASSWKTLWNITIPNIMPSITICTFLSLTNGFKLYDQNLALTGGSPFKTLADGNVIKTTEMLALNIVNSNTSNSKGPGQAKAVVFFILVAIISIAQLVSTRKKEVDQ